MEYVDQQKQREKQYISSVESLVFDLGLELIVGGIVQGYYPEFLKSDSAARRERQVGDVISDFIPPPLRRKIRQ